MVGRVGEWCRRQAKMTQSIGEKINYSISIFHMLIMRYL